MTSNFGPETQRRIEMMFSEGERDKAVRLLSKSKLPGDRVCIAALKKSRGNLEGLKDAIKLGQEDYRDLLVAVGFGSNTQKHLKWFLYTRRAAGCSGETRTASPGTATSGRLSATSRQSR